MDRQNGLTELLREIVQPEQGKISALIFSDPEVYRLELERIFAKCWLFVAHESEIPSPGDYVTRLMAQHSVVVAKGEDGQTRVFLNSCRHRGRKICRADLGNSSHFRCPYHGFTYKNTGELTGVPFHKEIYGNVLDWSQMGLIQARVDSYAGLIFASWDPQAPSLDEYLGDMKWYLDILVGRAEMKVVETPQRWRIPTNWKIPTENFASDAYHTAYTHASIAEVGLSPTVTFAKEGWQVCAGNGHTLGIGTGVPGTPMPFPKELVRLFETNLDKEKVALLKKMRNVHGNVFPNLSFLFSASYQQGSETPVSFLTLRQWQPLGPNEIEAHSWFLIEKEAPQWWEEASRQAYILTQGAAGIVDQDDAENWADINEVIGGPLADRLFFNYVMGLDRQEVKDFPGPGQAYQGKFCEAAARDFYGRWLELCT